MSLTPEKRKLIIQNKALYSFRKRLQVNGVNLPFKGFGIIEKYSIHVEREARCIMTLLLRQDV